MDTQNLIGGVALACAHATFGRVLHGFALGHKHHLMDVALAESYCWVTWSPFKTVSGEKKSKPMPKAKSRKSKEKAEEEVEDVEQEKKEKNELSCSAIRYLWAPGRG